MNLDSINQFLKTGILAATKLQLTKLTPEEVLGTFEVTPSLLQPAGILNGGVSFLVAETISSVAANTFCKTGSSCVGVEISGNHLEAVKSGEVSVKCIPLRIGSRIQLWQVNLFREDLKLSFTANCTLLVKE
jgi:1,4-dihydroxy-2-naphthoyl-CoA hydrolase